MLGLSRGIISSGKLDAGGGGGGPISSLLLHMDGTNGSTTFTDSASPSNTLVANGDAQLSTTGAKFGTACGLFDGTGDSLNIASPNFEFESSDFCIDFWVNNDVQNGNGFIEFIFAGNDFSTNRNSIELYTVAGGGNAGKVAFEFFRDDVSELFILSPSVFGSGSYQHVALTREASDFRLFIGGVLSVSGSSSTATRLADNFNIGVVSRHSTYIDGRLDELRVVVGDAVYTSNFTPPTSPYAS